VASKFGGRVTNIASSNLPLLLRKSPKMPRESRRKHVLNTVDANIRVSRALDTLFEEEDNIFAKRRRLFEPVSEDDEWDAPGPVTGR
jgi:hypothetical protein